MIKEIKNLLTDWNINKYKIDIMTSELIELFKKYNDKRDLHRN